MQLGLSLAQKVSVMWEPCMLLLVNVYKLYKVKKLHKFANVLHSGKSTMLPDFNLFTWKVKKWKRFWTFSYKFLVATCTSLCKQKMDQVKFSHLKFSNFSFLGLGILKILHINVPRRSKNLLFVKLFYSVHAHKVPCILSLYSKWLFDKVI